MEKIDSTGKPFSISMLGNRKGFSLIEMAIVLVIIGIIIGAIVKGQDLITNSRAKQVTTAVTSWRNLITAFYDRNGRWPGDGSNGAVKNGVIGDDALEQAVLFTATAEIASTMQNSPVNPVIVGNSSFYVYVGSINFGSAGVPDNRNAILLCGDSACANPLLPEQLEIVKTIDTAIDGSADAGVGQFRGVTVVPTLTPAAPAANADGRFSGTFSGIFASGVTPIVTTALGTATPWANTNVAAIWLFDKPF